MTARARRISKERAKKEAKELIEWPKRSQERSGRAAIIPLIIANQNGRTPKFKEPAISDTAKCQVAGSLAKKEYDQRYGKKKEPDFFDCSSNEKHDF